MAVIYGKIESLKKIKSILLENDIDRFNSIGDINAFQEDYENEEAAISRKIEKELDDETESVRREKELLLDGFDSLKNHYDTFYAGNSDYHAREIYYHKNLESHNFLKLSWSFIKIHVSSILFLWTKLSWYRKTKSINKEKNEKLKLIDVRIVDYEKNRSYMLSSRKKPALKNLVKTKEVVDSLGPLIAGAIGENLVEKEIDKLPDNYILINDYSVEFDPPIYNRKENDRIYSIQIDHLLVTNSGVFILETKNWSRSSVQNRSLRSPVDQILRSSYALYVLLNADSERKKIRLADHHWGSREIPIKKVVVMINDKPREKFKFVQVKLLDELNGYVSYFDPIFTDKEVNKIAEFLRQNLNY